MLGLGLGFELGLGVGVGLGLGLGLLTLIPNPNHYPKPARREAGRRGGRRVDGGGARSGEP